jgi:hypothetical protein
MYILSGVHPLHVRKVQILREPTPIGWLYGGGSISYGKIAEGPGEHPPILNKNRTKNFYLTLVIYKKWPFIERKQA